MRSEKSKLKHLFLAIKTGDKRIYKNTKNFHYMKSDMGKEMVL